MNQALYNGRSGILTSSKGLNVWAYNIANVNNNGFRANQPEFSDSFDRSLAQASQNKPVNSTVGNGVFVHSTAISHRQGALQKTNNVFDLALSGKGWFGVQEGSSTYYTRDGAFYKNKDDFLVNENGQFVLGTNNAKVEEGVLTNPKEAVKMGDAEGAQRIFIPPNLVYPAQPTDFVELTGGMVLETKEQKFEMRIVNEKGEYDFLNIHLINKSEENNLKFEALIEIRNEVGEVLSTQKKTIEFDTFGNIKNQNIEIENGATPLTLSFGDKNRGLKYAKYISQNYFNSSANGILEGRIDSCFVTPDGRLVANFTNNKQSTIAQVGVFQFQNDQGLHKRGDDLFCATSNSGEPFYFKDKTDNYIPGARVSSSFLESSNVNTAQAMTELIIMQRMFEGNSRAITTSNEMLKCAIELKR